MFHTFTADQVIGNSFNESGFAAHQQDFQAIMMVQMDMDGRKDDVVMVVLDVCKRGLQVRLVMVVHKSDSAGNVFAAELLPVFKQTVTHHIPDGQGTVIVTLLARHLVELPQQGRR